MADDSRLPLELADGVDVVICDLLDPLVGKDLRILLGLLDGVRVIGPARCERRVFLLLKECTPAIPTGCEESEAVYEDDRLFALRVGAVDLLLFLGRENCHVSYSFGCRLGQSVRLSRSLLLCRESCAQPGHGKGDRSIRRRGMCQGIQHDEVVDGSLKPNCRDADPGLQQCLCMVFSHRHCLRALKA